MPNTLAVQAHLRSGGTLDDLLARYSILAKRHPTYPNLVHLKYNQIASPFGEAIVRECRGIILDQDDGWNVVARAFDKFFNAGEGHAAPIDWSTARVQEKVDGSLCLVYPYDGDWHVATTGTPDGGGDVNGAGLRFSDYFWQTFGERDRFPWPWTDGGNHCFFFELTGPLNRIVVPHREARLTLLGARRRDTWEEIHPSAVAHHFGGRVDVVRECPLDNLDAILASFGSMSPLAQEGYVVVDAGWRRIKVKHPGYVALHHAKDGLGVRAFVEIAKSGECPEVIAAFPELRPQLDDVKDRLDALVAEVEDDYARLRDIPAQKDFALAAQKTRCSAALFAVRARKAPTVRDFFAGVHVDQLVRLLGLKADRTAVAAE